MASWWDGFLEKTEILYEQMIKSFDSMFSKESLEMFEIVDILYQFSDYIDIDKMNKNYKNDIYKELEIWIKKEHEEGRLFQRELWKPFRNFCCMDECFAGYRKMFKYEHYYFQLLVDCYYFYNCEDFDKNNFLFFNLALYGWKDERFEKMQPGNKVIIPDNDIMPEWYWDTE